MAGSELPRGASWLLALQEEQPFERTNHRLPSPPGAQPNMGLGLPEGRVLEGAFWVGVGNTREGGYPNRVGRELPGLDYCG